MDQKLRALVGELRKLNSDDAAAWLIDHHPVGSTDWGQAMAIIPHLSWTKGAQLRLARHYLNKLPFASAKPYEVFASFMKVSILVDILEKNAPSSDSDRQLLGYYAGPALARAAKTLKDRELIASFTSGLKRRE